MGKAERLRRERSPVAPTRPRWAGANGFDYAWTLTDAYLTAGELLLSASDPMEKARATARMAELKLDLLQRELATVEAAQGARGDTPTRPKRERSTMEPWFPGDWLNDSRVEHDMDAWIEEGRQRHRAYAVSLSTLADSHMKMLRAATPILFDPLGLPAIDDDAASGLRLPFPATVCDFLAQSGMSLPVELIEGFEADWVGLVAATFAQARADVLDVWPVVTTLHARERDEDQNQRTLMYGRARFGAELPDPPEGLSKLTIGPASVWAVDAEESEVWAEVWIVRPALAAASALRLLEAVNVSVEPVQLQRVERRRMEREGGKPALEVIIRSAVQRSDAAAAHGTVDWQHRWTVRGHWKHFRRGPVFDANPRKRVKEPDGTESVRVWCPPFVKGPEGKPLVVKARRLVHGATGADSSSTTPEPGPQPEAEAPQ